MGSAKSILAGGAAAAIIAGAAYLFPSFSDVQGIANSDVKEFALAKGTFATLLDGRSPASRDIEQMGLRISELPGAKGASLLSEAVGECEGRGVYLMRAGGAGRLAITAPHRGSDRHTGTLASALFLETNAQAAAWNSAPRRATQNCPHAIDIARESTHLFTAFALGFAKAQPGGLVVQIHGFDRKTRTGAAANEAGIILSNGTKQPNARLLDLADCLSIALAPVPVLVYPGDTAELGALKNAQGQALRKAGFEGFVHLEMSSDLRNAMIENSVLRGKLAACLVEAAR